MTPLDVMGGLGSVILIDKTLDDFLSGFEFVDPLSLLLFKQESVFKVLRVGITRVELLVLLEQQLEDVSDRCVIGQHHP